jgi:putative oxidoreductase
MRGIWGIDPGWGITLVRLVMAAIFIFHGYDKLAGGIGGVADFFAKVRLPLPGLSAVLITALELGGGLLLLVGLFSRWLGLLFFVEFVVAAFYVKLPSGGFKAAEFELLLLAGAGLLFLAGGGRAAVDEMWLERREAPTLHRAA